MANGIGSTIGGTLGGALGTFVGGPLGTALGTAAGSAIGAGIEAIPTLMKTDAEKENERRLKELKRMQEMGTLGLTEAEKQSLFTGAQGAAAGQMRQAQAGIRAAGAAGMASGAGTEALRQSQLAEAQARQQAEISREVEAQDLQRKRELEDEIQARIAAQSQIQQERRAAGAGIASAAFQGGAERYALESTIQGLGLGPKEAASLRLAVGGMPEGGSQADFLKFLSANPNLLGGA